MYTRDDGEEFAAVRAAMKVLEMSDQEIWDILKVTMMVTMAIVRV